MKNKFKNWTVKRSVYLMMGIFFVITGIKDQFCLLIPVGIYAAAMAVFSFGCAAGNCALPSGGK